MTLKKILKQIKNAETSLSTLFGVIVVLVVGVLIFRYFQNLGKPPGIPGEEIGQEIQGQIEPGVYENLPTTHVIQAGEDLWKISVKYYNSGYNWVDIAKENNLKNPDKINEGMELKIPNVRRRVPLAELGQGEKEVPLETTSYTVVKNDNLWKIALNFYGDGYRWVEIARSNNLTHPNLIHPGNVLKIPR